MRNCEAVLYVTSLDETGTTPADLLAHVRGHWQVEHTHWLRDVIWKEDKSLIRTGNAPRLCPRSPTSSSPCSGYKE
jgi:predicted transposase YbfD/YdcC